MLKGCEREKKRWHTRALIRSTGIRTKTWQELREKIHTSFNTHGLKKKNTEKSWILGVEYRAVKIWFVIVNVDVFFPCAFYCDWKYYNNCINIRTKWKKGSINFTRSWFSSSAGRKNYHSCTINSHWEQEYFVTLLRWGVSSEATGEFCLLQSTYIRIYVYVYIIFKLYTDIRIIITCYKYSN